MITKFKQLYEQKIDLSEIIENVEDKNTELIEKIKNELSIITYKRKSSHKSIRIKEIGGYFNKRDFKDINLIYKTYLTIDLSNGDKVKAKLSVYKDENENNINIKINNDIVYNLDNKKFNNEIFVDKIIDKYKESLLKTIKIK
jgi:hypothetical protein